MESNVALFPAELDLWTLPMPVDYSCSQEYDDRLPSPVAFLGDDCDCLFEWFQEEGVEEEDGGLFYTQQLRMYMQSIVEG